MVSSKLNQRYNNILKIIIKGYIHNATPVGSSYASKEYPDQLSSATIRNIMSTLEELGYIIQPHTSAGRIPTDLGYRYYVDELLATDTLDTDITNQLTHEFFDARNYTQDLNNLIEETARFLSMVIGHMTIVLQPVKEQYYFSSLRFISLSPMKILLILTTTDGFIYNRAIDLDFVIEKDTLEVLSTFLNDTLQGKELSGIISYLKTELSRHTDYWHTIFAVCIQILEKSSVLNNRKDHMYVNGVEQVLEQPEFRNNVARIKNIVKLVEHQEILREFLSKEIEKDSRLNIYIGMENPLEELHDCTLVTTTYSLHRQKGAFAILGPKRMDYGRVVTYMESITGMIEQLCGEINDR